ncbi:helix-turn-helix domain-containing protein [Streptomyces sp. NPDC004752]
MVDDLRTSPAQVPPHLLRDLRFVQAAHTHDFPALFALAHSHGVSYYRIGEACGIKPERVSLIARGKATVTALDTIVRVADALRIPGALLGLAARPWEDSTPEPHLESDDGDDPMNRRQLLRGALAAGLTGAALTALTDTRQSLDLALAADTEPADLSDLEAATETYGYGYHGQAPPRCWPTSWATSLSSGLS